MLKERLIDCFKEIGFDEYKEIETKDIVFSQDVFDQCEKNVCGNFGKNHACKGGTVDKSRERVEKYAKAFLISTIVPIRTRQEMMDSIEIVGDKLSRLRKALRDEEVTVMGVGPCTLCKDCAALEGKDCRFPDKIQYSMEGSGIDVVRMSMNEKMTYNAGAGRVGYFFLVLFN